ncbi:hypothetical protein ASE22_00800 [Sphingomonas sp. Root720]|nr:hypothetical protein ASE22_00800 [Sphingomonas sp. Root720]
MIAAMFLVVSSVAIAAVPSAKPAMPATAPGKVLAPTAGAVPVRRITLSAEGRTIAARIIGTPDPRTKEIQAELGTIRQQKAQLIAGAAVDVEKLEPMLRREEVLQGELRTRQNDRLLSLLRALPDADRIALLHSMANPAKPDGVRAPVPATPGN